MNNKSTIYLDRRLMIVFSSLDDYREELKIVNHLIEFIYHYYLITGIKRNPEGSKVFQYYSENIVKPNSIEKMLIDIGVQIDAIYYIDEYYNQIILIKSGMKAETPAIIIDKKECYVREHYLQVMKYLLYSNSGKEEVRCIIEYLNKKGVNDNNIPDNYIQRIIEKLYYLT